MQPLSRTLAFGALLTLALPAMSLSAQATDPASGTWELNLAKSKFSPGPPPKSLTRTFEVTGADVKYTMKGIDAEGKPILARSRQSCLRVPSPRHGGFRRGHTTPQPSTRLNRAACS